MTWFWNCIPDTGKPSTHDPIIQQRKKRVNSSSYCTRQCPNGTRRHASNYDIGIDIVMMPSQANPAVEHPLYPYRSLPGTNFQPHHVTRHEGQPHLRLKTCPDAGPGQQTVAGQHKMGGGKGARGDFGKW